VKVNRRLVLLVGLGVTLPTPAYAYLDPGTISMLLQLLVGAAAGALVFLRLKWSQVKGFFGRRDDANKTAGTEAGDQGDADGD